MDFLKLIQASGHLASVVTAGILSWLLPEMVSMKERMAVLETALKYLKLLN
ncbi:hypothetical protein [Terasakiella sp. SH-1]|uniref:hypothetical protein n=1 Tax=Terasakiella sp. SH-1 TaxID=2560057 RepID=UPI00143178AB|nr:hypothetical protein [Terasakiella sp. SH-1]